MSNPLKKVQEISGSDVASSHDLEYLYGGEKPNAATQIGEDKYTYDMNGNPTLIENDSTSRQMRWDEENRLTMVNDDGYVSRYTYDHAGVRTVKSHGPLEGVAINGAAQGLDYHDKENYTIYVSPYMTVTADRFTKHYYAGTQRIASKIGGGGDFDNVYGVESFHLTAGQKDYADRLVMMESGVQEYYKKSGIPPGPPTNKGQNADPYATDVALPNVPLGDYSVPSGWPTDPKFNAKGDVPGPPAMWQPEEDLSDPPAGYGFTPDSTPELEVFYFHTDHLGSTSYLTDSAGSVCQFVCYTPYGEAFVDEHSTTYENPFKFSGKELDDITGLYDHGARSRNPITTIWLGVDNLFESYTDISPYAYCKANPLILLDPDGNRIFNIKNGEGEADCYEEIDDGVNEELNIDKSDFSMLKETFDNHREEYEDYLSQLSLNTKGYDVAMSAREYEGSSDYAYDVAKNPVPKNMWKCNLFVYDMLTENDVIDKIKKGQTIPQAKHYTSKNDIRLKNLDIVSDGSIHLGDVIAGKHNYSDASGHVEIVTKIYPKWMEKNFETTAAHQKTVYKSGKGYEMLLNSDGHYNPVVVRRSRR